MLSYVTPEHGKRQHRVKGRKMNMPAVRTSSVDWCHASVAKDLTPPRASVPSVGASSCTGLFSDLAESPSIVALPERGCTVFSRDSTLPSPCIFNDCCCCTTTNPSQLLCLSCLITTLCTGFYGLMSWTLIMSNTHTMMRSHSLFICMLSPR